MVPKARLGDPYIPTPAALVRAKLEFGEVTSSDTVYDLGCGDGRVLIIAAREYGARGVGVDLQLGVVEEAWQKVSDYDLEDLVEIRLQDFEETDLSEASLLILYLTTRTLHRLSDKLREVRPGTRLVTHDFALPGWQHSEQSTWTSRKGETHTLYLYRKT